MGHIDLRRKRSLPVKVFLYGQQFSVIINESAYIYIWGRSDQMEWNQHVLMILLTAVMLVSLLALCYAFTL